MADVRILFWNVGKRDLTDIVCTLVGDHSVDVVVLNENEVLIEQTLVKLRLHVSETFSAPLHRPSKRFHCFSRDSKLNMGEAHFGDRMSVRHLTIGKHRVLLALVHGIDVRNNDANYRQEFAHLLSAEVRFVQEQQKIRGVIMLGDFNMNPYDAVMNLATGFNAMMTRDCVGPGVREYRDTNYDLYYNPMWGLFGDNTAGPAGTIYDRSRQGPLGWSMFDQVLFHHSTIGLYRDVQILTKSSRHSLSNASGRPDSDHASDHFPLLVTLKGEIDE